MKIKLLCSTFVIFSIFSSTIEAKGKINTSTRPSSFNDQVFKGNQKCFDYIIVGFGSAGAILARKLSDDFKTTVLVLEAGGNHMLDPNTLNPDPDAPARELTFSPLYANTYPIPVNDFQATTYSEGCEFGGSAAHNDLMAVRGVPEDFNEWALNSGNARWSYKNVFPLLKGIETYTPNGTIADFTQRGNKGPISITQKEPVSSDQLIQAIATVAGAPLVSDYNNALLPNTSTSALQEFVTAGPNNRRSFSAFEFMTIGKQMDIKGRGLNGRKCRVKGNSVVTQLLLKPQKQKGCSWKVTGVEYLHTNKKGQTKCINQVFAKKKIILCAGAINSPKILQLSGIGDPEVLNKAGVAVKVANKNVGAHFRNQYGASATITYPNEIPGGISMGFINGSPFMPADTTRRLQVSGVSAAPFAQLAATILHPKSLGTVKIVSKDPLRPAQVIQDFYSDGDVSTPGTDAYLIVSFFKIAKAIAESIGQTIVYPSPETFAAGDEALLEAAQALNSLFITYHGTGTARFGTSRDNGVVNGNLQVFGVKNLMVADNSVTNPPVSGNTCLSAYIVGLVASQILGIQTPPIL